MTLLEGNTACHWFNKSIGHGIAIEFAHEGVQSPWRHLDSKYIPDVQKTLVLLEEICEEHPQIYQADYLPTLLSVK